MRTALLACLETAATAASLIASLVVANYAVIIAFEVLYEGERERELYFEVLYEVVYDAGSFIECDYLDFRSSSCWEHFRSDRTNR